MPNKKKDISKIKKSVTIFIFIMCNLIDLLVFARNAINPPPQLLSLCMAYPLHTYSKMCRGEPNVRGGTKMGRKRAKSESEQIGISLLVTFSAILRLSRD